MSGSRQRAKGKIENGRKPSQSVAHSLLLLCFLCLPLPIFNGSLLISNPLTLAQTTQDRKAEADRLKKQGIQQAQTSQFEVAIESWQQALQLYREIKDRQGEGAVLGNLGIAYLDLGNYAKAIDYHEQSLMIAQEIKNRRGEGAALGNLGLTYYSLGNYAKAIEFEQQLLVIAREVKDRQLEGNALGNLGLAYKALGSYAKAIEYDQQALMIAREIKDRLGEEANLSNLGNVYYSLGNYAKAIEYHQQALAIAQEIKNRQSEGYALGNLGLAYDSLGNYAKAIEYHQQQLVIMREIKDRQGEGHTLGNLGLAYDSLRNYAKAVEYEQQALAIAQEIKDRLSEGRTLGNLGNAYRNLGNYAKAIEYHQQYLKISRAIDDRQGESKALGNLGSAYDSLGNYTKAIEYHQQLLAIAREIGDRESEGIALNNIGITLEKQRQLELAIVFYKQSVNVRESIRQDIRKLPREQQESYTQTVAHTYRSLADLLLQQDRVLEAQQVLDLLKVQELNDYLRNVRGGEQPLIVLRPEAEILQRYGELQKSAIQVGSELAQLRKTASQRTLTAAEEKRLESLDKLQEALNEQFNQFTQKAEIVNLVAQLQRSQEPVKLEQFDDLRRNLAQLGNAVLLYPLILDDRIELILTLPNTAPLRRTVYVKRAELNQTILEFRQALQNPNRNAKVPAQKLYTWLIQPLEADLKQVNAQTIIYAPDGQLRYIPLAALYDGKQWLVQRFRTNNITASSLTKFGTHAQPQLRILAGAFANQALTYTVPSGDRSLSFVGLPFAGKEVETLQAAIPNTVKYIDAAFSLQTFKPRMNGFSVVHLATHAAFVPGAPEDSFILFGDGKIANLQDIGKWDLENVDLVVLSACETGVGIQAMGAKALGDGKEVLGLGYQFQNRGARATIASLWQVDDGGTQTLMTAFYQALQKNMTKAEALQQAQIALITNDYTAVGNTRASLRLAADIQVTLSKGGNGNLKHPYYWAPFILIGNGL